MNIYRYRFIASCPNDGARVAYTLTIETDDVLMAEDIEAACRFKAAVYHENLADELHARFGGQHTITAKHGKVDITTVRSST